MKTKVIIASAFTVLSLTIVGTVFATSNQTEEQPVAKAIETVSTKNEESVTAPVVPEQEIVSEVAPQAAPVETVAFSQEVIIAYATSLADESVNDGALVNVALAGEQYLTESNYKAVLDGMKTYLQTNKLASMGLKLAELQRLASL